MRSKLSSFIAHPLFHAIHPERLPAHTVLFLDQFYSEAFFPASPTVKFSSELTDSFLDGLEMCWLKSVKEGILVPCLHGTCPESTGPSPSIPGPYPLNISSQAFSGWRRLGPQCGLGFNPPGPIPSTLLAACPQEITCRVEGLLLFLTSGYWPSAVEENT